MSAGVACNIELLPRIGRDHNRVGMILAQQQANAHHTRPEFGKRVLEKALCGFRGCLAGSGLPIESSSGKTVLKRMF